MSKRGSGSEWVHALGHVFVKKKFKKPHHCHHCAALMWGLTVHGLECDSLAMDNIAHCVHRIRDFS